MYPIHPALFGMVWFGMSATAHMFLRCYLSKGENEDLYFKESEKASNRDWLSIQEHHLECSED